MNEKHCTNLILSISLEKDVNFPHSGEFWHCLKDGVHSVQSDCSAFEGGFEKIAPAYTISELMDSMPESVHDALGQIKRLRIGKDIAEYSTNGIAICSMNGNPPDALADLCFWLRATNRIIFK